MVKPSLFRGLPVICPPYGATSHSHSLLSTTTPPGVIHHHYTTSAACNEQAATLTLSSLHFLLYSIQLPPHFSNLRLLERTSLLFHPPTLHHIFSFIFHITFNFTLLYTQLLYLINFTIYYILLYTTTF